jgi:hypothetical protein
VKKAWLTDLSLFGECVSCSAKEKSDCNNELQLVQLELGLLEYLFGTLINYRSYKKNIIREQIKVY